MSIALCFILINSLFFENTSSQSFVISGNYQGKNLYVQNPFASNMKDFCTDEVFLNEVKIMDNIKSSAYEIDLSSVAVNSFVNIKITHKEDCKPKILNSQVIRSINNFVFATFTIDEGEIKWITKGESKNSRVFVEQFLYNNWIVLKEVPSKGSASSNSYAYPTNHNSGLNKYRIRVLEKDGNSFYSKTFEYVATLPEVTFFPKRVANKIYLSRATDYEIVDGYGNPLLKGKGKEITCENLSEGVYYLNIDNKTEKFLKK